MWISSLREWSSLSKKSFIWTIISVSLNWFFDSFIQLSVNYFAILRFSVCFCLKKVLLLLQNQSPVVIFADRIFCFSFEAKLLAFLFWQLLSGFKGHLFFLLVISLGISFPMHCHCQFHCQWISYWPRVSFRFPALWLVERVWVRTPPWDPVHFQSLFSGSVQQYPRLDSDRLWFSLQFSSFFTVQFSNTWTFKCMWSKDKLFYLRIGL